jgi:hypothetical protein
MTIVFESVIDYLEKCGLIKTARVMRRELKVSKDIILDSDKELHLMSKLLSSFWLLWPISRRFLARKSNFELEQLQKDIARREEERKKAKLEQQ